MVPRQCVIEMSSSLSNPYEQVPAAHAASVIGIHGHCQRLQEGTYHR